MKHEKRINEVEKEKKNYTNISEVANHIVSFEASFNGKIKFCVGNRALKFLVAALNFSHSFYFLKR